MEKITRYDYCKDYIGDCTCEMDETDFGSYVLVDDVVSILKDKKLSAKSLLKILLNERQ